MNRSSKVFISFVWTSAMAPEVAVPAFAQSVASPEPTSTTLASMGPWVEAVPGAATARSGNDSGAVAATSTVPGIQRKGRPKLSVSTESTPAALSFSAPQVTARSIAELPVMRPPTRSQSSKVSAMSGVSPSARCFSATRGSAGAACAPSPAPARSSASATANGVEDMGDRRACHQRRGRARVFALRRPAAPAREPP